jgi:hypothetical protein
VIRRNTLVDHFVAMWNERDTDLRRKQIEELYAEDAVYVMFARDPLHGYDAIAAQIDFAHNLYFDQGFVFRSSNNAEGHHNLVKFGWVLVSADTGELESYGSDFFELNDEGRIVRDYQFLSKPAFSLWEDYIRVHPWVPDWVAVHGRPA